MSENKAPASQALREAADKLLAAAYDYWKAFQREQHRAAVLWLQDSDGKVLIFTRGEYRERLMAAVDRLGEPLYFVAKERPEE